MDEAAPRKRVLIVDDASTTRTLLRKLLEQQGLECTEAASGEEAVKLYHAQRPDLVTLDIHMDKLSGMGVVQVLLKLDPKAKIVIVTSETEKRITDELLRMGAKDVVQKPFSADHFHEAIAHALQ
ncbi:MAG: response regulator [Candidatus Eremiobacteraeota bacterium]|nr:response regulator [Candidatus Eremiobacteraeota bacterium]